ncbi:MAG: SpoIID/LytB domain-containing protein [Bacillaceae bacterium]|nr:SpoIID/LytB domain-containing protein [Bacillaceae bacterium]
MFFRKSMIIVLALLLFSGFIVTEQVGANEENSTVGITNPINFEKGNDGKWLMSGREGQLTIPWSGEFRTLNIHLPKNGPGLFVSDGFEAVVSKVTNEEVVYKVNRTNITSTELQLTTVAVQEETEIAQVNKIEVAEEGLQSFSTTTNSTVTIRGGGFGHRVGMSQWGAQGLANRGVSHRAILSHYYPGTQLEARYNDTETVTVRLNNDVGRTEWIITPSTRTEISNSTETLEANRAYEVTASGFEPVDKSQPKIDVNVHNSVITPSNSGHVEVQFSGNDKRKYLGELQFVVSNSSVTVRNRVDLQNYLIGVVPNEALASWNVEALKTQAVAARTFAASRNFGLRDTQADQVYRGVYEEPGFVSKITNVVRDTRGEVLTFGGNLISAVYSSSNGGWIESNNGAWGSTQVSYLSARQDRFNLNGSTIVPEQNTHQASNGGFREHSVYEWERKIEYRVIEQLWPSIGNFRSMEVTSRTNGQGAANIRITGTNGTVNVTGTQFRSAIGTMTLLSTYIFPEAGAIAVEVDRIAGDNRYDTAARISQRGWNRADTVVLARGDDFADALAGVSLAHRHGAPILLTSSDRLRSEVRAEIERLGASNILILGGNQAIHSSVERELRNELNLSVRRIAGTNRIETAVQIAREVAPNGSGTVAVVNGYDFPDALSIAPYAAQQGIPILLTRQSSLPSATQNIVRDLGATNTLVVGGATVVGTEAVRDLPSVRRLAGDNRYETNIRVHNHFSNSKSHLYVATGAHYADALTGAALAAKEGKGIILTRSTSLPTVASNFLADKGVYQFTILGGPIAVHSDVVNELRHTK